MKTNRFAPRPDLKIYLDGELVPAPDAKISVFDHALLYGDGVFEGIRVYNGRIFECQAHLNRLFESAAAIRLEMPVTREELVAAMEKSVKANGVVNGYIRVVVTRGVGTLGIDPQRSACPSLIIIADRIQLFSPDLYEKGMAIITAATCRNHPNAMPPRIKSLNYLNNILAKLEAIQAGCEEAVMLNHEGYVAECTGDNIFIIKDGALRTPPPYAGLLLGITRAVIIKLARRRDIAVQEMMLTRHDLYTADECFLTGTGAEIMPVTRIDNRVIGSGVPGAITRQLLADFVEYRSQ